MLKIYAIVGVDLVKFLWFNLKYNKIYTCIYFTFKNLAFLSLNILLRSCGSTYHCRFTNFKLNNSNFPQHEYLTCDVSVYHTIYHI